MKTSITLALVSVLICFAACQSDKEREKDIKVSNQKADSINAIINSPELKAVNTELVEDPNNAELYIKRAKIYLRLAQLKEAISDSKLAIKLDSTQSAAYICLADVYFAQNNTRLAKETLLEIEKKFPENTEALLKLAELYYLVKQYQNGITYINKALKIDASLSNAYFMKGSIYRESGDTARAVSSLETAIEQDNKNGDAFYDLGVIYSARKNPLAIEYYNNALKINPNNYNAEYARAKFFQDTYKTEAAIIAYNNLIQKKKDCEQCYYNLGAIYLEIKKDNKIALENFTKAIAINSNYVEAYFARGLTYFRLNDKQSASADYKMCLKLQPNYEAAIEGLNHLK